MAIPDEPEHVLTLHAVLAMPIGPYTCEPRVPASLPDRVLKVQRTASDARTTRAHHAMKVKRVKIPSPSHRTRNPQNVRR